MPKGAIDVRWVVTTSGLQGKSFGVSTIGPQAE